MVKQKSWDVKTVDMKCHATMVKNKGFIIEKQRRKRKDKAFRWGNVFVVLLVLFIKNHWFARNGSGIALKPL